MRIGLNSPRYSRGACGFMSYMSRCDGPPLKKIMMTDFCRRSPSDEAARRRSTSPSVNPPIASAPTRRNLRRLRESFSIQRERSSAGIEFSSGRERWQSTGRSNQARRPGGSNGLTIQAGTHSCQGEDEMWQA